MDVILKFVMDQDHGNRDHHDKTEDKKYGNKVGTVTKMRDRLTASPPVLSPQPSAEQVVLLIWHYSYTMMIN